jgi:peroxiredoxin
MAQLRLEHQKFLDREADVIAIGPERAGPFTAWWHEHKMPFTGIPDPQHKIAKLYGQQIKFTKFGRMPALVVIDKKGMIRFAHYGEDMTDIPTDDEILALLDELNKEQPGKSAD